MVARAGPINFPWARFLLCPSLISYFLHFGNEFQLQHKASFLDCPSSSQNSVGWPLASHSFTRKKTRWAHFLGTAQFEITGKTSDPLTLIPYHSVSMQQLKCFWRPGIRADSAKVEFSGRMPEGVTGWRDAEEPGSRKVRIQAILHIWTSGVHGLSLWSTAISGHSTKDPCFCFTFLAERTYVVQLKSGAQPWSKQQQLGQGQNPAMVLWDGGPP